MFFFSLLVFSLPLCTAYSDDDHSYWTGYFVSRPALKRYVRSSSALLQVSRQLELFGGGDGLASLPFEKAVAITQHHDAVAGTAKQHVAFDYAQRLHLAQAQAQDMMAQVLANFTLDPSAPAGASLPPAFSFCELANISVCLASTSAANDGATPFQVTLYNSAARAREEMVTMPIWGSNVIVQDQAGELVQAQVLNVLNVSSHSEDSAALSLNFLATVPALGFRTFFVSAATSAAQVFHASKHLTSSARRRAAAMAAASTFVSALETRSPSNGAPDVVLQNALVSLTFSGSTGLVSSMSDKASGVTSPLGVQWGYYDSFASDDDDDQKSGAYIFRPQQQALNRLYGVPQMLLQTGPLINEVTLVGGVGDGGSAAWINQTFRLLAGSSSVALEYTVGEVPIEDGVGKEVVVQYVTPIASQATWFADSNGREMQKRVRDFRPTWNFTVTEPISGNCQKQHTHTHTHTHTHAHALVCSLAFDSSLSVR